MPTGNVNLTDHYDLFVEKLVVSGQFSNASEVVRAGLRLLEQQVRENAEKLEMLRSLASQGFGESEQEQTMSPEELDELLGRIGRRVAEKVRRRSADR